MVLFKITKPQQIDLKMQPTLGLRAVVPAAFATLAGLGAMRAAYAEIPLRL